MLFNLMVSLSMSVLRPSIGLPYTKINVVYLVAPGFGEAPLMQTNLFRSKIHNTGLHHHRSYNNIFSGTLEHSRTATGSHNPNVNTIISMPQSKVLYVEWNTVSFVINKRELTFEH